MPSIEACCGQTLITHETGGLGEVVPLLFPWFEVFETISAISHLVLELVSKSQHSHLTLLMGCCIVEHCLCAWPG